MSLINWKPLARKSKDCIKAKGFLTVLEGAVRSSKTITANIKWLNYVMNSPEQRFLMSGNTIATLYTNVIDGDFGLLNIADGLARYYSDQDGNRILEIRSPFYPEPKICYCVGGHDESSFKKIRGRTIGGWYADEVNLQPKSFVDEALRRSIVSTDRFNLWTLNPDNPEHWIYKTYVDEYLEKKVEGYNYFHFTLDDNLAITPERKDELKRQFKGAFYSRYILGLRTMPEGLVYEFSSTVSHEETLKLIEENKFFEYFCAVDWGWNHNLSCGLYGVTAQGDYYKIDQLYGQKLDAYAVIRWIDSKQKEYKRFFRFVNCDNENPEQCEKLRLGYAPPVDGQEAVQIDLTVYQEKPDSVKDSVGVLRSIINHGRLYVNKDRCPDTAREFSLYRYPTEEERLKKGIDADKPLKENDDAMDETRYGVIFYETNYSYNFKRNF